MTVLRGGGEFPHFMGGALLAAAVGQQLGADGVVGHNPARVTAANALRVVSAGACLFVSEVYMRGADIERGVALRVGVVIKGQLAQIRVAAGFEPGVNFSHLAVV